jgi:hypothetical protein
MTDRYLKSWAIQKNTEGKFGKGHFYVKIKLGTLDSNQREEPKGLELNLNGPGLNKAIGTITANLRNIGIKTNLGFQISREYVRDCLEK